MLSLDIIFVPFSGAVLMLEQPFFDAEVCFMRREQKLCGRVFAVIHIARFCLF